MSVRVYRTDDVHNELAGQIALGPIAHTFESAPSATQTILFVAGGAVLRQDDKFDHTGASHHKPQAGSAFACPSAVTKSGRFTTAGQDILFVDGSPVMTLAGHLETCSDAARQTTCDAAILLAEVPPFFVQGSPVLPGN